MSREDFLTELRQLAERHGFKQVFISAGYSSALISIANEDLKYFPTHATYSWNKDDTKEATHREQRNARSTTCAE